MPLDAATQKTVDKLLSNNASADHPEIKDALAQMEVELKEKLGTSHLLYKDHQQLRRFLVARKLKLDETMEMINNHMEWRARMLPVTLTEEVKAELKKGKMEVYGTDIQGRPLLIVHSGRFDPKERDLDTAIAACVYLIEKTIAENENQTQCSIMCTRHVHGHHTRFLFSRSPLTRLLACFFASADDRDGFSFKKNWDFDFLKTIAKTLSDNYPERLAGVYVHPSSSILAWLWSLIKNFFDGRTRAKVKFITSDKELLACVPAEFVAQSQGGTSTHTFDPSIYDVLKVEAVVVVDGKPVEIS